MEEDIKGIQDYVQILKRSKKQIIITAATIFLLAVIIAIKLPSIYKSTATILIEQQEIPQELVRSTVTSYADQRIQVISQRVMSSENLKEVVNKFNLYTEESKEQTSSVVLDAMRESIQLEMVSADVVDPRSGRPTQATIAFTLSFSSKSPKTAQQVTNELVSLYLNENLKRRTQAATETTNFLSIEAQKLTEKITQVETELAEFKEKNAASLPELQQLNMQLMDRSEQQIIEVDRQINALTERKLYLSAELAQINPNSDSFSVSGERIYGTEDRLKVAQSKYVALKARYASSHPDVVKIKRVIAALEKEVGAVNKSEIRSQIKSKRGELSELAARYSDTHPDIKKVKQEIIFLQEELNKPRAKKPVYNYKPDNPAYIQLHAQLQAANADLSAMRDSKDRLLAKLERYEAGLLKAPQVERQYTSLMRNYENATTKYREVKSKLMEADMAQAMEKSRKGERFTLVEPPLYPEKPFKPNRKAIVFLGLVLALGAALGLAFLKASLDRGIYGTKKITALTGAPPMIVLPYFENDDDINKKQKIGRGILYSIIVGLLIGIVLFNMFIMPLDVLWYVVLRKLGLSAL